MREVLGGLFAVLCVLALLVLVPLAAVRPRLVRRLFSFLPDGAGRGIVVLVSVALATVLGAIPLATAIASIVSVAVTEMAPVYFVEAVVGIVPFVV